MPRLGDSLDCWRKALRPGNQMWRDAERRPMLFRWGGPEDRGRLEEWAAGVDGKVPDALLSQWAATGGGELFETETLLSPVGDPCAGDDVDGVTLSHRERGLPRDWVLFHVGWGMSAFNTEDGRFAWFEAGSYSPSRIYESLDGWYVNVLRAEFAQRYGL